MKIVQDYKIHSGLIPKEIKLPNLNEICRMLDLECYSWNRERIKTAIRVMGSTLCISEEAFYDKKNKKYINSGESFTLIKKWAFKGDVINGQKIDHGSIEFTDIVHNNLEQSYVKSLDFDLIKSFKSDIAPILYPHLSAIFNNFKSEQKYWEVAYRWLAQRLGITIQKHQSLRQQQLEDAHNELISSQYLKEVEWLPQGKIRYYFGEKAVRDKIFQVEQKTIFSQLNKKNDSKSKKEEIVTREANSEVSEEKLASNEEAQIAFLSMRMGLNLEITEDQLKKAGLSSLVELQEIAQKKGFVMREEIRV